MPHLAAELLKLTAKIDLIHMPYNGAAPAVNDLMAGHVQSMFADVPVLLGAVQSGKLKALAVGSKTRVAAPTNLPADIAKRLFAESVAALKSPDVKDRLEKQGLGIVANPSAEFTAYVKSETERWARVIKDGKIIVR
jgi:tripartite-type tricarboxylate transporter receptor subunit TctC